jgi:hypothetical protein
MTRVGTVGAGRGVGAGPVHDPREGGQPDLGGSGLSGALDRLQHAHPTVLFAEPQESGSGGDQTAGLLGGQFGDLVGQRAQRFLLVRLALEPPFSPPAAGLARLGRRAGGPTRAVHSTSLISM